MKRKLLTGITALVVMLFLCSCVSTLSSSFKPSPPNRQEAIVDTIKVCKAVEDRPLGGKSRIGIGFLTLIPLMPFATQQFTPERYMANQAGLQYSFLEDISQTVDKDLKASGIARHIDLLSVERPEFPLAPGCYVLCLTLHEGIWNRNFTTYGLSFAGAFLWLGLPVSYGSVILKIEAVIYDRNGKQLGTKVWLQQVRLTEWIYSSSRKVPRRLLILYDRISPELRQFVAETLEKARSNEPPEMLAVNTPKSVSADNITRKLEIIKNLKKDGTITEEEYQSKKKKLIDEL